MMTVRKLLEAIAHNPGLQLSIYNYTAEIITFEAAGYEAISSEIGDREVNKITVSETGTNHLKIYLKPTIDENPEEP